MSVDDLFDSTEVRPGIGHNRPPLGIEEAKAAAAAAAASIPTWLCARDETLLGRIGDLLAAAKRAPKKITSREDAEKMSDFRSQLAAASKAAEMLRATDKRAFEEPASAVHGFWRKRIDELDASFKASGLVLQAFLVEERRKADEAARKVAEKQAEAARKAAAKNQPPPEVPVPAAAAPPPPVRGEGGSQTGLRHVWTFRDLDPHQIDLEALRPYFTAAAVEQAVRAAIADGVRELKGVVIYEKPTISTR